LKYAVIRIRLDGIKIYGPFNNANDAHGWVDNTGDMSDAKVTPLMNPGEGGRDPMEIFTDKAFGAGVKPEHLDEMVMDAFGTRSSSVNNAGPVAQLSWLYDGDQPNRLAHEILQQIDETEHEPDFIGVFAECVPEGDSSDRIRFNVLPLLQRMGPSQALAIKDGSPEALKLWNDHLISESQQWPVERIICEAAIKGYYAS
jgi:hypothetical protein